MPQTTAPPGNGSTTPHAPADVIVLGRLAASALAAGRAPTPAVLLAVVSAPRTPAPDEPQIAPVVASLSECGSAMLAAVAALAMESATLTAADVADRTLAVLRAVDALYIGDASDAPLLLDALADGLDVLAYPLDTPIVGCPGHGPDAYCGRIVPVGAALCRGCTE